MKRCSLVRVRRRFWGKPRGHGCPRSFSTPPCPPTRRMRIWFATAPLPDYGWRQTMSLSTAFHKYNHVCAEGFLAKTRRERRTYPSAVCKERATTSGPKRTAARRVASLFGSAFVAPRSQPHFGGCSLVAPRQNRKSTQQTRSYLGNGVLRSAPPEKKQFSVCVQTHSCPAALSRLSACKHNTVGELISGLFAAGTFRDKPELFQF